MRNRRWFSWRVAVLAAAAGAMLGVGAVQAGIAASGGAVVPLVIYGALGYDETVAKAFSKATGIPTRVYDDHTGIVLAKIAAEKNNPQWDIVWIDGDQALAALDKQGLLLHGYEPNVPFTAVGRSMIPANKAYVPTGFSIAGTIIYNSATLKVAPPTKWRDLLSPDMNGRVAMLVPGLDGPAYPFVAGVMDQMGMPGGKTFFLNLKKNGLRIFNDPHQELAALKNGQVDVIIGQSVYGIGMHMKDPNIRVVYPDKVTVLPNAAAIDARRSAQAQAEAKQFIAFSMTQAGHAARLAGDPDGDSLFWPVVDGLATPPGVPSAESLPLRVLDPYLWGSRQDAVVRWFTGSIVH